MQTEIRANIVAVSKMNDEMEKYRNNLSTKTESTESTNSISANIDQQLNILENKIMKKIQTDINTLKTKLEEYKKDLVNYIKNIDTEMDDCITVNKIDVEKPDFAFLVSYHTEIMTSSFIQKIETKLYYFLTRSYDQNAVKPSFRVGDCIPLKFNENNFIVIKLRDDIFINGVTYEHISINLLPGPYDTEYQNVSI